MELSATGRNTAASSSWRLPITQGSTTSSQKAPPVRDEDTAPKSRVLVVDDNQDAADCLALVLRHAGHDVQIAYGGESAIETALRWQPDAILLDIGLPDLDGYEVARRLRSDPKLNAVRLLAVTGYGGEIDRQRVQQVGFDAYLVKPADPKKIQELLVVSPVSLEPLATVIATSDDRMTDSDLRESVEEVIAGTAYQLGLVAAMSREHPKAVVLELVDPAIAVEWSRPVLLFLGVLSIAKVERSAAGRRELGLV